MTNQLTQAELIDLAKQAGFKETIWSGILGVKVESLAKFAQLIQQRQGGGADSIVSFDKTELLHSIRAVVKDALFTSIKGMDLTYAWQRADEFTNKHISEIYEKSIPTVDASQLVAQALEKAAEVVEQEFGYFGDEIRALKDQPVEQGGDELMDVHTSMAAEYQEWIDFYHAGNGDYSDFMSIRLKERNGNA